MMTFDTAKEWYEACAAMVREGVTFSAFREGSYWKIEFDGGF
jgi:hypothetical protein